MNKEYNREINWGKFIWWNIASSEDKQATTMYINLDEPQKCKIRWHNYVIYMYTYIFYI